MAVSITDYLLNSFFGDHINWIYLFEIMFRTCFMFIYMIINVHFLFDKDITEFNSTELIILLAFGSAVGDAMIYRNVPLIISMLAITVATLLAKLLAYLTEKNAPLEKFIDGKPLMIIHNGKILEKEFNQVRISKKRLLRILRLRGIQSTNEIKYAFAEGNGQISIIKTDKPFAQGESTLEQ